MGGKGDGLVKRLIEEMHHHNHHNKNPPSTWTPSIPNMPFVTPPMCQLLYMNGCSFKMKDNTTFEEAFNTYTSPLAVIDVGK
jgi:hypothetical protein